MVHQKRAHLIEVRLKGSILRPLLLDLLLTGILPHLEYEADTNEHHRDYQDLQPVTDGHPRKPVHLGQAIPRLDEGTALRTSFFLPTERFPFLMFRPPAMMG